MIDSIIICNHNNLGYSASLRFSDSRKNIDISASDKYGIYRKIDFILKGENNGR